MTLNCPRTQSKLGTTSRSTMVHTKASMGEYLGFSTQFCGVSLWWMMTPMTILNMRVSAPHQSLFMWIMHVLSPQPHWNFQVTMAMMSPWATWSELYAGDTMIWQALYSMWISTRHLWRFNIMTSVCIYHFPSPSFSNHIFPASHPYIIVQQSIQLDATIVAPRTWSLGHRWWQDRPLSSSGGPGMPIQHYFNAWISALWDQEYKHCN